MPRKLRPVGDPVGKDRRIRVKGERREELDPPALAKIIVDIVVDELGGRPFTDVPRPGPRRSQLRTDSGHR